MPRRCKCGCGRIIDTYTRRRMHWDCEGAKRNRAKVERRRVRADLSPAEIEARYQAALAVIRYQRKLAA